MLKFTNQELLAIVQVKWEAEQNLQEISKLINFVDQTMPDLPPEVEERFKRFGYGR